MITLPSGVEVELAPFTGKIERLLEDKNLIKSGVFTDRYLTACVDSIDGDSTMTPQEKEKTILDMRSGDRNYLLLHVRINAYGPDMVFNNKCPQCNKTSGYQVNLEDMLNDGTLKIHPYPEEPARFDLPSGGWFEINHMTGRDERKFAQLKNDQKLSTVTILRIASLNGNAPKLRDFEELSGRDLMVIREAISEFKGGLIPTINLECLECGNSYDVHLSGIPDFFVPSKTRLGIAGG